MGLTLLDEVQSVDWEKYAAVAGKPLPFLVFGTSILGFILQRYLGIQVYVFFISFLVALLEVPWLFYCIGPAKRARDHLVEDFGLGKGWVRGILYIVLSILCYVSTTPSIALLAGLLLDMVAILYVLSSVFSDHGVGEGKGFQASSDTGSYQPPVGNGFGTF